jgi:hypothetical protein
MTPEPVTDLCPVTTIGHVDVLSADEWFATNSGATLSPLQSVEKGDEENSGGWHSEARNAGSIHLCLADFAADDHSSGATGCGAPWLAGTDPEEARRERLPSHAGPR